MRQVSDLAVDDHLSTARLIAARCGAIEDVETVSDRRQRVAQFVRQHGEKLVLASIGLAQLLVGRTQGRLGLHALHGRGDLVGDCVHGFHIVGAEVRPRPRPERQGADELSLHHQRMTAVGLDSVGSDQAGSGI